MASWLLLLSSALLDIPNKKSPYTAGVGKSPAPQESPLARGETGGRCSGSPLSHGVRELAGLCHSHLLWFSSFTAQVSHARSCPPVVLAAPKAQAGG